MKRTELEKEIDLDFTHINYYFDRVLAGDYGEDASDKVKSSFADLKSHVSQYHNLPAEAGQQMELFE